MTSQSPRRKKQRYELSSSGGIADEISESRKKSSSSKSRDREHERTRFLSGGIMAKIISAFDSARIGRDYHTHFRKYVKVDSQLKFDFGICVGRFMKPRCIEGSEYETVIVDSLEWAFRLVCFSELYTLNKRSSKGISADIIVRNKAEGKRMDELYPLVIVEVKHNLSYGDAFTQLMDYYRKGHTFNGLSPSFLLQITPQTGVLFGAINVNGMTVVSQLQTVHFKNAPETLYALLVTIRESLDQLQELVLVESTVKAIGLDSLSMKVPLLKTGEDGQKRTVHLKLCDQMAKDKLVFRGTLDSGAQVVAKFCSSYGLLVHQHMFAKGLAPDLLVYHETGCTSDEVEKWILVVMEYLSHSALDLFLSDHTDHIFTHQEKETFCSQLTNIGTQLSENKFVHGDLRMPNVLVDRKSKKLYVIDFDWSGTGGEVLYPLHVDREKFYHLHAVGMLPILQTHDEAQIRGLKGIFK